MTTVKNILLVILVVTILFTTAVEGRGGRGGRGRRGRRGLCSKTDFPQLCRPAIQGKRDPASATAALVDALIAETKVNKAFASRFTKSAGAKDCAGLFDDAIDDLEHAQENLKAGDKGSFNSNVSGVVSSYATCTDSLAEMGEDKHPLNNRSVRMQHMASNCLAMASLMKWQI